MDQEHGRSGKGRESDVASRLGYFLATKLVLVSFVTARSNIPLLQPTCKPPSFLSDCPHFLSPRKRSFPTVPLPVSLRIRFRVITRLASLKSTVHILEKDNIASHSTALRVPSTYPKSIWI